jgi:hypothetical protein
MFRTGKSGFCHRGVILAFAFVVAAQNLTVMGTAIGNPSAFRYEPRSNAHDPPHLWTGIVSRDLPLG